MVQQAKLNREMIVREAIALLQEGGLEALTLRQLAARLGVRAPSLARHVGDKAQLLSLVSSTIFLDALDSIPPGLRGSDWLIGYGRALHAKQRETRDITALIATAPRVAEMVALVSQRLATAMDAAGLVGPLAMNQQTAIQALVTGWVVFETSPAGDLRFATRSGELRLEDTLAALVAGLAEAVPQT